MFRNRQSWFSRDPRKANIRRSYPPIKFRSVRPTLEILEDRCVPTIANIWSASGASGLWNTAANWSLGHVPTSIEIATFDATSAATCQIDAPTTGSNLVSGLNMTSAYLGSITDTADLTIGTDGFVGGTFTVSGSTTITDDGDWAENVSGGFTGGTGTVVFDSLSSQTIQDVNSAFNNLTHFGPGTLNLTAGATPLTLSGNLVNFDGTLDAQGASITLTAANGSGNWTDLSSVINLDTVNFSGNQVSQTLSANSTFNNLIYSGSPTLTLETALTVTGNLTVETSSLSSGTLDANDHNITVSGLTTITGSLLANLGASPMEVINLMGGLSITAGELAGHVILGGGITATSRLGGPSTIFGQLDLGGSSHTFTVLRGADLPLYVFAVISNGGLTKDGDGILQLANTNTYSGGTIINAGMLDVTQDGALGPGTGGTLVAAGGVLGFGQNVIYNTTEPVTLNGGIIVAGFSMASFAGPIFLNSSGGTIESQSGMFILSGPINAAGFDLSLFVTGRLTINGDLNAGGTLTQTGPGMSTINGTNTFTGGTDVQGGTLGVGNDNAVGSGTLTLADGTAILAAGADHSVANAVTLGGAVTIAAGPNTLTFSGNVTGNGSLTLNGNLTLTDNNSYTGGTTVNAATLGVGGTLGSGTLAMNNASLLVAVNGTRSINNPIVLTGSATFGGDNTIFLYGAISGSGSLTDSDTETLRFFNSPNTYSGGTIVTAGTLYLVGGVTLGSGPLTLNDGTTLQAPFGNTLSNPVTLNGISSISGAGNGFLTLTGTIGGTGGFMASLSIMLTGNNTYSGTTTETGGALVVNGSQPNSPILILTNGSLSGTGTVGPVTLDLDFIHPGPFDLPGILSTGNLQSNGGGLLEINANGPAAGSGYSQLKVNGTVTLGSGVTTLSEASNTGFSPGTQLRIIDNLGTMPVSGFFAGLPEGSIFTDSAGNRFQITYQGGDGNDVVLIAVPQTDDIIGRVSSNGQWWLGISNGSAFTSSQPMTWSTGVTWVDVVTGDFNGDGKTDIAARAKETGDWWMSLSNGSGGFTTSRWTTWSTGGNWVDVQVGDFDGGGKADIVGRDLGSGTWWVALSTGTSFQTTKWATWSTGATWVDVKVGDFDGDGKADITGRALQNGQWYTGLSNGSAFTTSLWATWSTGATWVDVQVGDFNGDGKADITGRYKEAGTWWTALSNATSFVTSPAPWAAWSTGATWVDVRVGDFNGDGKADIIGRALENGQWYVGMSNGSTGFTTSLWAAWSTGVTWVDVQVGDFNGDGKSDVTGRALQTGDWWTAVSTGSDFTTTKWATWSTGVTWTAVRTGDFA